jgi:hypothetical protein
MIAKLNRIAGQADAIPGKRTCSTLMRPSTGWGGRDLGVEGGVVQLRVPEQDLDDADINAVLEEMGGETVAQRVRSDPPGDLRGLCRLDDDAMQLPGADWLHGVLSWKQPTVAMHHALLVPDLPPLAQQGEQIRREHGIAIPATLATLDPDQHALAVDIGDLERRDLSHAETGAIGDREGRLMLEAGGRVEQSRDLVQTMRKLWVPGA